NIALSDLHLFRASQNFINRKSFKNTKGLRMLVLEFFNNKNRDFTVIKHYFGYIII
ncbi:hypothetical protein WH47_05905, partial [Habropoda laboriosa]